MNSGVFSPLFGSQAVPLSKFDCHAAPQGFEPRRQFSYRGHHRLGERAIRLGDEDPRLFDRISPIFASHGPSGLANCQQVIIYYFPR
jgi:hypothetical protein